MHGQSSPGHESQPISHQSAVVVKVLADQFKCLWPVLDIDHQGARRLGDMSLKIMLLAHFSKDIQVNGSQVPRLGYVDSKLDPVHSQFEVIFSIVETLWLSTLLSGMSMMEQSLVMWTSDNSGSSFLSSISSSETDFAASVDHLRRINRSFISSLGAERVKEL